MDDTLLSLAVADAIRGERAALATFTRGDPYNRRRYTKRGLNRERQASKRFHSARAAARVDAQQEIEFWLRRRGVRWHQLARVIAREYGGNWSKIEDAIVRWGHVKGTPHAA